MKSGLHIALRGKGRPVLGLAGFGCSNWIFDHWTDPLCRDHLLILPDNRGMGLSTPVQEPYEMDDLAADALGVLKQYAKEPAIVLGVSMGGFIAQLLALKAPQTVQALVLMCTSSSGEPFVPLPYMSREAMKQFYELPPRERALQAIGATTHPSFAQIQPQRFQQVVQNRMHHASSWSQVSFQYDAVQRFMDRAVPLEHISCPVLVMTGADDRYVDPRNASMLVERLPNARLVVIERTDHLFFLEEPEKTVSAISEFLESLL